MKLNRNNNKKTMEGYAVERCKECNSKLEFNDDFEDVNMINGCIELCMYCTDCDEEYIATFRIERVEKD